MDYELAYVERRAAEERKAGQVATGTNARDKHVALARLFEEHAQRIQGQDAENCA